MGLTPHQRQALRDSVNILHGGDRLLIKGSAGVGKTYLANNLISAIDVNRRKQVLCAAPTNKAVAVLKEKVTKHGWLQFTTIHSALKLKRFINNKTGTQTFKPWFSEKNPPLKDYCHIVVDEASMIAEEILEYLEEYCTKFDIKLIFLGDEKQLNPVGEEESSVFHQGYPEVELTEIVRQGEGNPIIDLSRNLDWIWFRREKLVTIDNTAFHGFTFTTDRQRIIKALAHVNGTDELKYLAWTNREVDNMNFMVRKEIYGNPNKIELGESLIFNAPYEEDYFTNQEIKVEKLNVLEKSFDIRVKSNKVTDTYETENYKFKVYEINGSILALHEDSDKLWDTLKKKLLTNVKQKLLEWVDYYSFVELLADLKYNHAITVHKSQGSTYEKTIVNVRNLNMNKRDVEKERLFYTAITRASKMLILYNV